jgi:N-acetylglucosamine-6-phosphate deacetylase
MKCHGLDPINGEPLEVSFNSSITGVDSWLSPAADLDYLAPGFIDLQVNGFAGVDYCSPGSSQQEIGRSIRAMFATGVTRFFPTVITGSPQDMSGALANLAAARRELPEGPAMEAFHVEGPFISPDDGPRGAHPQRWVRPPDFNEYRHMQDAAEDNIRLITISPEWPQAPHFIEEVVCEGVVVSIGHTKATSAQIQDAVHAGATMSTHLGNGAHATMSRHPNYIWDQLAEDRLTASFIVDRIHLGHSFLKTALRAKGIERSVLITDAVMPAGCQPGPYKLGEVDVELHADGSVRLLGGTRLAGSALHMDRGITNVMQFAGLSLREAVTMATRNPARAGRISSRQRGLAPGERADLVRFRVTEDGSVRVLETYLGGELVFKY